jgi:uncharacterized membrane protein YuzA (DUF378 family)
MLRQAAAPLGLLIAGIVVLIAGGGSTATQAVAFALIGVACVIAVSLAFLAVGRAEDAERAAAAKPPEPEPEPPREAPREAPHHDERPALKRRRPRPPRRPR